MADKNAALNAYKFFLERMESGKTFAYEELKAETGWSKETFDTYRTKLGWSDFIERLKRKRGGVQEFRVKSEFLFITKRRFLDLASQTKRVFAKYDLIKYEQVMQYELLLPLTREELLRKALDRLFYADDIDRILKVIGQARLEQRIGRDTDETYDDYLKRVAQSVSKYFKGYSISHVSGRYLAGDDLLKREEAAAKLTNDEAYVIDETTASVRFIIPLKDTELKLTGSFDNDVYSGKKELDKSLIETLFFIRWLFFEVFAKTVVKTVEGEEQIWLIEESPLGRELYVWKASEASSSDKADGVGSRDDDSPSLFP